MPAFVYTVMPPTRGDVLMALDQVLLERWDGPLYLRFFAWAVPTVSLGVHQNPDHVVDTEKCSRHGVDVVRRPTGGAAVLHHLEVTYSVVGRPEELGARGMMSIYAVIARCLMAGLEELGVPDVRIVEPKGRASRVDGFCFAQTAHYEIASGGQKLIGSAQKWARRLFVQHGSILLDFDEHLADVFRPGLFDPLAFTTLRRLLGRPVQFSETVEAMLKGFRRVLGTDGEIIEIPEPIEAEARERAKAFQIFSTERNREPMEVP